MIERANVLAVGRANTSLSSAHRLMGAYYKRMRLLTRFYGMSSVPRCMHTSASAGKVLSQSGWAWPGWYINYFVSHIKEILYPLEAWGPLC